MARQLNLRQIEAFKAVIEQGTVSRGAKKLNISQPAMSKLIAHLEADTGLKLFDRLTGRLAPTENALRLYKKVERIFAGVRQVESAVDAIRREEQGRLIIGAMPALAGAFIQRVTTGFLARRGDIFCCVRIGASRWIIDGLDTSVIDIGLVGGAIESPHIVLEPLMEHPLVCIIPIGHPLAEKRYIEPKDLQGVSFVSFDDESYARVRVDQFFDEHAIMAKTAIVVSNAPTLCEFVAAGIGVSLVHPLMASGFEGRLAIRPFEPAIPYNFQIGRSADSRNARFVEAFARELREKAALISEAMLGSR